MNANNETAADVRTLKIPSDNFDRTASFRFSLGGDRTRRGYLFADSKGKIFILQACAVIASSYSAEEVSERNRLSTEKPLCAGDLVEVDGKRYTVSKLGDFSDAGKLIPA